MPLNANQDHMISCAYQLERQIAGELAEQDRNGQQSQGVCLTETSTQDRQDNEESGEDTGKGDNFWDFFENMVSVDDSFQSIQFANENCRVRLQGK